MSNLTFDLLREANRTRLPLFKNSKGELAHVDADGSDWSINDWIVGALGELGELADMAKKVRRGDITLETLVYDKHTKTDITVRAWMAKEIADTACYLDLIGNRIGVDIGQAIIEKFNEISDRVKAPVYLVEDYDETLGETFMKVVIDPSLAEEIT